MSLHAAKEGIIRNTRTILRGRFVCFFSSLVDLPCDAGTELWLRVNGLEAGQDGDNDKSEETSHWTGMYKAAKARR
jgi:hypothetical protein